MCVTLCHMKGQLLPRYFLDFCALIAARANEVLVVAQMIGFLFCLLVFFWSHNCKIEFKAVYSLKTDNFLRHTSTLEDIMVN